MNLYFDEHPELRSGDSSEEIENDILFCNFAYGFTPEEYFAYQLKEKNAKERRRFLSERDRLVLIYHVNDMIDMDIFRDKSRTYEVFGRYYHRDVVSVKSASDYNSFESFIRLHPTFVKKSVSKNCGLGVELVEFHQLGISRKDYFDSLVKNREEYILEERVAQSEVMGRLNKTSVNTVRVVTCVDGNEVKIVNSILRIGRNHSFLDNGSRGGILVQVNEKDGTLKEKGYTNFSEIFTAHPDSNISFKGYQLPDWQELLSLVSEISRVYPSVRCIGWDFAHTDVGWVLIEANGRPQFTSKQIMEGGMKDKLYKIYGIHK
jgi:hypothetical protein